MARSVREAVLARVQRLGAAPTRLLEAAALAGEPFGAALLASACALSELEALAALEQAVQAQLVCAHEEGGYGWVHDLARQAVESALTPAQRRLMQHRLALAAEAQGARAAAALYFEACGEAARAAPHRLAAGDAAHALQAFAEAARHWRQGLANRPPPAEQAALLARLCLTAWTLGQADEARACRDRLQALLPAAGLAPDTQTDLLLRVANYLMQSDQSAAAMDMLDRMPPARSHRQRLPWLVARMGALHQTGRLDEARADGAEALSLAAADARERADVLANLSTIEHGRGQHQAALAHADECVAVYTRLGDGGGRARGLVYRGIFHSELGDYAAAEADLRECAQLAGRFGNVHLQRLALYNVACNFSGQTRPDDTLAVAQEGWALNASKRPAEMTVMYRSLFVDSYYARGDWGLAWEHAAQAVDEVVPIGQPPSLLGVATAVLEPLAVLGQWPRALPLVQALTSGLVDQMPGGQEAWLGCAQAALLQRDPAAAADWLNRMQADDGLEQPRVRCRVLLLRAALQLALGDAAKALAAVPADDAPGMNDELRLRALALRCQADSSPALHERARQALADPRAHAGAALQLERALGGAGLAARVERLAQGLVAWPEVQASFIAT
jgi:tetratricopeptide (TPR) repeat protein